MCVQRSSSLTVEAYEDRVSLQLRDVDHARLRRVCGDREQRVQRVQSAASHLHLQLRAALTCFCEPGAGSVGVDRAEPHHLVELGAFADGHADQRVGLLRHHQHLKHLQRTGQREVDVLWSGYRRYGRCELISD